RGHVPPVLVDLRGGQLPPVRPDRLGPLQQRIVHVGGVLHVVHAVPGVPPHAVHHVEGHIGVGVAEVGGVVGGDAADVHARLARAGRADIPDLAGGGVVQAQTVPGPGQAGKLWSGPRTHTPEPICVRLGPDHTGVSVFTPRFPPPARAAVSRARGTSSPSRRGGGRSRSARRRATGRAG